MDPRSVVIMVLLAVVAPFVAAWMIAWSLWRGRRGPAPVQAADGRRALVTGVVVSLIPFAITQCLLLGVPAMPPREALHWVPLLLVGGLALGLFNSTFIYVSAMALAILLNRSEPWSMVALLWGGSMLAWRLLGLLPGRGALLVPMGTHLAACAMVLVATGNLRLGQLAAAGAMSLLGALLVHLSRPRFTLVPAAASGVAAFASTLLAQGMAYGDTPRWAGLSMGLGAPFAALIAIVLTRRHWSGLVLAGAIMLTAGAVIAAVNVEPLE
jgi:hypothetical protein